MKNALSYHAPAVLAMTLLPFGARAFDGTGSLVSQGITRDFIYHAPGNAVADGLPLVLVFHGTGGSGAGVRASTGFDAVSDANNFVVVYPNSTTIGGDVQWNVYADDVPGHAGVGDASATDDVVFVDDLIDWFCANHHIDPARIYATGHSNGGFLTYLLAVQRPDKIAAFAPASGSLWGDDGYLLNAFGGGFTPVAIYHVHGDPDLVVPYPDAVHDPIQWTWPLSSFGSADCGVESYTATPLVGSLEQLTWCDGSQANGKAVVLIRVPGLGHAWANVSGYNASEAIWSFFSAYVISAPAFTCAVGVQEDLGDPSLVLQPSVVEDQLRFSRGLEAGTDLIVLDAQGRQVFRRLGAVGNDILLPDLAPGCYRVNVREPERKSMTLTMVKR